MLVLLSFEWLGTDKLFYKSLSNEFWLLLEYFHLCNCCLSHLFSQSYSMIDEDVNCQVLVDNSKTSKRFLYCLLVGEDISICVSLAILTSLFDDKGTSISWTSFFQTFLKYNNVQNVWYFHLFICPLSIRRFVIWSVPFDYLDILRYTGNLFSSGKISYL